MFIKLSDKHILEVDAQSYQEALSLAMEQAHHLYPEYPFDEISVQLLERESDFPTILAHGIAAPHLHSTALSKPVCLIVKLQAEIDLKTYDGYPIRLLFVLISPENEPEMHLRLLAEIAKIASNEDVVKNLMETHSKEKFVEIIRNDKTAP